MKHRIAIILVTLISLALTPAARAQDFRTFTLGLYGGLGGSFDADPDPGLSNQSFQLSLSMVTERNTLLGLRVGQMSLDGGDGFGNLREADLSWVTAAGEYRFRESFYDSGLYLGLGLYDLDGTTFGGRGESDSSLGLAVGATGDFRINRRLSVLVEISGHFADFEPSQFYGMLHAGIGVHF